MRNLFDKFVKGHNCRQKNAITVRLSGWQLVAILGVIGVVVSCLCFFRFHLPYKKRPERKMPMLEEKHGLKKSEREIGFIFREPGEKHELVEQNKSWSQR